MQPVFKIIGLILIALLGGLAYAVTVNLMIKFDILPVENLSGFGEEMTQKAVMVWMGCVLLSIVSLFVEKWWRHIFAFSPLYGPSIFSIAYTLIQT